MRSIAEIDRDHEGMGRACVRSSHGCTYPTCECDRSKRIVPNVRGIGGPRAEPTAPFGIPGQPASTAGVAGQVKGGSDGV